MTRFEKLEGYPEEIRGRFNSFITTQFDDSLSVEMQIRSLIKWISSSRDLINDIVDYINLFIEMFDERLQEEIVGRLNEWLADGTLAQIINNDVFDMKADKTFVDSEIERLDQKDEDIITQLTQFIDSEIERLDQKDEDLITQLEHTTSNVNSIRINALFPPVPLVKLKTYTEGETSQELKNLISYCSENKVELFIPSGTYLVNETIELPRGFTLTGAGSEVWANEGGTKIRTTDISQSAVFKGIDTSIKLSDFKIENGGGLSQKIGVEFDERSYNFEMTNVIARGFDIGFKIADAWTYKMSKCRTEAGRIGFQFRQGTSAEITACVSFNATEIGFDIAGMTYSVFTGSGSDGCSIGLKVGTSTRGVTFVSFGVENASQHGWLLEGSNIASTFTAPNFGNHSTIENNLIKITGEADLTITDLRLTTAFAPNNHNFIDINNLARLTLINPAIYGKIENLWEKSNVTIIGGRYAIGGRAGNKINGLLGLATVSVNKINTVEGSTGAMSGGATYKVDTLTNNSTYLFTAHTNAGTQHNISLVRVDSGGTIRIHPILNETIDFVRGVESDELLIENMSSSSQTISYSGLRLR